MWGGIEMTKKQYSAPDAEIVEYKIGCDDPYQSGFGGGGDIDW